ncbi:MAG TPA: hypothetical protein VLH37_05395 [Bacteroidales bacterium]|nr:hypothetical protein [Bacteroidales bacterium]
MIKLLVVFGTLSFAVFFGQRHIGDRSLASNLEGQVFGCWKSVLVEFLPDGRYAAYFKEPIERWAKQSRGYGIWEVNDRKIYLLPNDSPCEGVRNVKGVYTFDGNSIKSKTHFLPRFQ